MFRASANISLLMDGYESEVGFYNYVDQLKAKVANSSIQLLEDTTVEVNGTDVCSGESVIAYLYDHNEYGSHVLRVLFSDNITRHLIDEHRDQNAIVIIVFLLVLFFTVILTNIQQCRLMMRRELWIPRKSNYFVITNYFYRSFKLSGLSLLLFIIFSSISVKYLSCHDMILKGANYNDYLEFFVRLQEVFLLSYMFCNFNSFLQVGEIFIPRVAFLFICYRKMSQQFTRALPLLLIWMYLIFGILFYSMDFEQTEFSSLLSIFYSPLRILLNEANFGKSPRMSLAVLHTMFVLIVSLNVQNFLIAFISNEFNQASENFQIYYRLGRLYYNFTTWRSAGFLLRFVVRFFKLNNFEDTTITVNYPRLMTEADSTKSYA